MDSIITPLRINPMSAHQPGFFTFIRRHPVAGLVLLTIVTISVHFSSDILVLEGTIKTNGRNDSATRPPPGEVAVSRLRPNKTSFSTETFDAGEQQEGPVKSRRRSNVVTIVRNKGPQGSSICDALKEAFNDGAAPEEEEEDRRVVYTHENCDDFVLGNRLVRVYMAWVLAKSAGASFSYQCHDPKIKQNVTDSTVTGLLQKVHETLGSHAAFMNNISLPTLTELCDNCDHYHPNECQAPSIDLAADIIRRDYRFIAAEVTPAITPSDVAIHYRCGDFIGTKNSKLGLLPHATFADAIVKEYGIIMDSNNETTTTNVTTTDDVRPSISIVTQPFDAAYLRRQDRAFGARCKVIVEDLVAFLQEKFPSASIAVHNDPLTETLATTYARLILARRVTVCGSSTFCVLATVASLGRGYINNSTIFPWIPEVANRYDDVELYDSPMLTASTAKRLTGQPITVADMSDEDILGWLRNN